MNGGPNAQETITMACIMDCPTITVCAGKHYKVLIDSGAAISLLCYSTYQHIEDSFKTPVQPKNSKFEHHQWFIYGSLGYDSSSLQDSRFQIYTQLCDLQQATRCRNYFWHRYSEEVFYFIHLGKRKELLYTMAWQLFNISRTVNRRPQLAQSNHHLKYCQDTMVSSQLRPQD